LAALPWGRSRPTASGEGGGGRGGAKALGWAAGVFDVTPRKRTTAVREPLAHSGPRARRSMWPLLTPALLAPIASRAQGHQEGGARQPLHVSGRDLWLSHGCLLWLSAKTSVLRTRAHPPASPSSLPAPPTNPGSSWGQSYVSGGWKNVESSLKRAKASKRETAKMKQRRRAEVRRGVRRGADTPCGTAPTLRRGGAGRPANPQKSGSLFVARG
jgi:hypothetical protein